MSNKLRLKLIIVLAICMLACTIAGCSIGFQTYDEFLEENNIVAQVTYYGNGGYFSENSSILSVEVSYTTGSMIYTPVEGTASQQVMRYNYDLVGWYSVAQRTYTETNDDGEDEDVLYFVLDITEAELTANTALVKEGDNYYFEYTSELTTGSDDDEEDTSDDEFDDDAEIDTSYLTQRMYYIKDGSDWIMSQEDYDYYVRIRKEYNTDNTISVPNLAYGEAMDSSYILKDGEHLYMVAEWTKSVSINYILAVKDGEVDGEGNAFNAVSVTSSGTTYTVAEGEVLFTEYFGTQSSISRPDSSGVDVTLNNATVLAFYYDEACTQRVNGSAIYKAEEDVTIYALCIYDVYTVIRTPKNVENIFKSGAANYYIFADDEYTSSKVFDCTGVTVSPLGMLSGKIEGNGYTITNLTVSSSSVSGDISLFGSLYDGAKISDLTIDGLNVEYQTSNTQFVTVYLVAFAGQYDTGKTTLDIDITGLTIKNVKMYITLAERSDGSYTIIRNIQYQSESSTYEADNWLYGDDNASSVYDCTDADFIATYGGATVESSKLYIRQGLDGEYVLAVSVD